MNQFHRLNDAIDITRSLGKPVGVQSLSVEAAVGRTLAHDVCASASVPPFDRAMMDGYAIRTEDLAQTDTFRVVATTPAGHPPAPRIGAGEAVRIMTGAPVPPGADAVVRFEWTDSPSKDSVRVLRPLQVGESIQSVGDDGLQSAVILEHGRFLTYIEAALLQTFGVSAVPVYQKPRVAILVTGNEIVQDTTQSLRPGQIYGCNDLLLRGCVEQAGGLVHSVDFVPDDKTALISCLARRIEEADCVITTGGVSAGDFDYVPFALSALGAELHISKVWMRPGSPFVAASAGSATVFGLSGNPAACLIQFETIVRHYFDACLGLYRDGFPDTGILAEDLALKPIKHTRILRAKAEIQKGRVFVSTGVSQSPGILSSLRDTNCLIRIDDAEDATSGTEVPLHWFHNL